MYLLFVPILLIGLLCLLDQQMFTKLRLRFGQNMTKRGNSSSTLIMSDRQLPVAGKVVDSDIGLERNIVRQAINQREYCLVSQIFDRHCKGILVSKDEQIEIYVATKIYMFK